VTAKGIAGPNADAFVPRNGEIQMKARIQRHRNDGEPTIEMMVNELVVMRGLKSFD
jgi:hypothetical protein